MLIRAIAFADQAAWHIPDPLPVAGARWKPLHHVEQGLTHMGAAFQLLAGALQPGWLEAGRSAGRAADHRREATTGEFDAGCGCCRRRRAGAIRLASRSAGRPARSTCAGR